MSEKRKILVEFTFDWDDCEDIHPDLMIEDAIEIKKKGVGYEIIQDSITPINNQ